MNLPQPSFTTGQQRIIRHIQVNIPFTMLMENQWLDFFINSGLNPEIGLDAAALDGFSRSEFKDIADTFHRLHRSITIHGPFMDLSPGSLDPKIRDLTRHRFDQLVDAVAVFRPKNVVCHAGYDSGRYDFCREQWTGHTLDIWNWLGRELHDRGARLMLENVYESDPADIVMIFQQLDKTRVGYCLDVGHQSVFGKIPLKKWLAQVGGYIGHIHLHDNAGDRDSHLGMGKGNIDFDVLFEFLKPLAKLPVITLEPHEADDLLTSLAYLEQSDFLSLFP
jgi:sugar phosphate isomerase/epimerase